ncbi:MAG: hypothetical protein JWN70_957 [Planctomycetaceae bacterium]|nr:hypothetical protein [Planctomycetaceae bacterium]
MRLTAVCLLIFAALAGALRAEEEELRSEDRGHWSFRPRLIPAISQFKRTADLNWIRNPIDAFVLEKLHEKGLQPTGEADRRTLIRRVYFDLTGLPPTPEDVDEFVNNPTPDAYERLIDRLLASPHYGERAGQQWLDIVRFAETEGFEYDRHLPHAWRYRDYVIRAFQDDKPYDQFLREQLAGDEISPVTEEGQIAAGFLRWGPIRRNAGNADVAFSRNEVLTEMTDTVGVTLLGMTMGCARCHDHKFDPIRQKDYYHLQAFLASTFEIDVPLADAAAQAAWKVEFDKVNDEIKKLDSALDKSTGDSRVDLLKQIKAAEKRLPPPLPTISTVRNNDTQRTVIHVLKRGDDKKPGDQVGPRAPSVFLTKSVPEMPATVTNPRTSLANWIVDPQNPITSRVIVNRIWLQHFGRGIVNTPNDFGLNGDFPSHPELLDYLANELVASGWSLKSLHRLILTSRVYRQASTSAVSAQSLKQDPDKRFLWKFSRQRLPAEAIRDAMLAVSGRLNRASGGPSIIVPVDAELVDLLYKPSQWMVTDDVTAHQRRSIYLIKKRNLRLPFMEVFDQPALQSSCPKRESSTHAPQALELLNGAFSNDLALAFAKRLERDAGTDRSQQVDRAFQLVCGRLPTDQERQLSLKFLEARSLNEFALAMFNLNDFVYVK